MFSLKKGFTLIELLIVITIIGILSSIVLAALGDAKAKSQSARMTSEIKQFQSAMEAYRLQNNGYYSTLVQSGTRGLPGDTMTPFITAISPFMQIADLEFTQGGTAANFHLNFLGFAGNPTGLCGTEAPSPNGYSVIFRSNLILPEFKKWSASNDYYCFLNI